MNKLLGKESEHANPQDQDSIQKAIGGFGRYQLYLFLLIFISKYTIAFHIMAILFLAPKVVYTCPGLENALCPCPNPEYDTSVFTSTIITKWNLICERKWLTSLSQMLFQFGVLVGSFIFGIASDKYGRKKPLLAGVILQVSTGVAAAYVPDYWLFTFIRFLIGVSVGGTMVIGFVVVMEFVGTQYRDIASAIFHVQFNFGHMLITVFGYYFRDYSQFQVAISIPAFLMLSYFCLVPETPRWLIAMNRTEEAIKILERVAKVNNRPTDNIRSTVQAYQESVKHDQVRKGSIMDVIRSPYLRKNLLAMSFDWLTCSFCFYGVSQYVGQLSGNVFINVAASSSVTMLGTLLSIPLMRLFNRKPLVIGINFICAVCLLILCVIPEGIWSIICASTGVVSSFIVFVVVYLYCTELFPTVVRNAAIGFSSMAARIGSMVAPFVIDLGDIAVWMPPLTFAILPLIATFVTFILPETKGWELTNTIEEGERLGQRHKNARK